MEKFVSFERFVLEVRKENVEGRGATLLKRERNSHLDLLPAEEDFMRKDQRR